MASAYNIIRYMAFYQQDGCDVVTIERDEDLAEQIKSLFGGDEFETSEKFDQLFKGTASQIVNGFISGIPIFYEYNSEDSDFAQYRDWQGAPEPDIIITLEGGNTTVRCWILE